MKFSFLYLLFVLFLFSFLLSPFHLSSIEVGGHLTEDTTWSPVNNPYEVTEILYVDASVALTILPGTEIKVSGASCTNWVENSQNFWLINGDSVAKMFWVDGRIIAEGTEQDSILFTRLQDDPDFYWGTIYITEQADISRFKQCKFEFTAGIGLAVGNIAYGAISIYNGSGIINNCLIINNTSSIITRVNDINKLEISENIIEHGSSLNDFTLQLRPFEFSAGNSAYGYEHVLISENDFQDCFLSFDSSNFTNNNLNRSTIFISPGQNKSYISNCEFINCDEGISGGGSADSIYINNNRFYCNYEGIDIDEAYVEISDNYFEGCGLSGPSEYELIGIVKNNIITSSGLAISGRFEEIYNNIFYDCGMVSSVIGSSNTFSNNIMINNNNLCNLVADTSVHENNILINNDIEGVDIFGNPIFRNCIIDFELEYPLIDGGGNIIVDSLQAQSIFEDIQNGDFHLVPGSIAIDAGFDTLGYYYPFDLDYNHRIWDGDGNGTAIIDIGPYEYGAPAFGGIQGITYDPTSGDFVDYVLIKINNEAGEFTFSDSIGAFEYKLPAGVYDVYAERVFYDDVLEYQVEVIDGQFTELDIPMTQPVRVEEHEIPHNSSLISHLSNYPNPFNPSTTIRFETTNLHELPRIEIYNLKGQKVKQLVSDQLSADQHSVVWNGTDENNKPVASGIYFYQLIVDNKPVVNNKMLLLK
ncbi:MAG: T9SS type A sorting domain-containing protein [Candidatus Cloacimonadales bacterium]|nr:T9SS type A sorting domain-containing protein [Candidatus Cloacimonadales bacterium]